MQWKYEIKEDGRHIQLFRGTCGPGIIVTLSSPSMTELHSETDHLSHGHVRYLKPTGYNKRNNIIIRIIRDLMRDLLTGLCVCQWTVGHSQDSIWVQYISPPNTPWLGQHMGTVQPQPGGVVCQIMSPTWSGSISWPVSGVFYMGSYYWGIQGRTN